jgi:hypothetical protein
MMGDRWEVQILTSTTVMDVAGAELLAKKVYDVVRAFSQSMHESISIGRSVGTESTTQGRLMKAKI